MTTLLRLALLLVAFSVGATEAPRNVILLIADGAGPAHFTALRGDRGADFQIARMPVVGLVGTSAANRTITDSAAGATALSTGVKTNYEMVGVAPDGTPRPTVLQIARAGGKVAGIVTTAYFWDATPAAFVVHSSHRREHLDIIRQMLRSGTEVIAGGGFQRFGSETLPPLAGLAEEYGYRLITAPADLDRRAAPRALAVFQGQPRDLDHPEATLPLLTRWAIERLASHPAGFFLMIEHEGTDSSSHQNNSADLRKSLISFDEAVGVALDFATSRGDTLVVVTADHETGGLRITETPQLKRMRLEWSTTDHTATMVPVFAFGPGADAFGGLSDNTEIGVKLREAVMEGGWTDVGD